jgi:ribosomal protein S27AE
METGFRRQPPVCPKCRSASLLLGWRAGHTAFYPCERCGTVVMLSGGRERQQEPKRRRLGQMLRDLVM